MAEKPLIGEFLERNQDFIFHLPEYIESTRFIEQVQERFTSYCQSFSTASSLDTLWQIKRDVIKQAVRDVPIYDGIDWTRPDYWESIAFIDKNSIRAHPKDFLNPKYEQGQLWLRKTSGTTGMPIQIWYSPEFFFEFHLFTDCKVAWLADMLTSDVRQQPIFCMALADNKDLSERVWASPDGFRGLTLRPTIDERRPSSLEKLVTLLDRHRPALLTLKPNILDFILRNLSEPFKAAFGHLHLIISSGADLDEDLRQMGQRLLNVPIINVYGLSEVGLIASECIQRDGLHVNEQDIILELLMDNGEVHQTGTGELVVSSVANSAMPLLRYKTEDIVELTSEPCICGKKGRRILNISGRRVFNFKLPNGSEFAPTNFNSLFKQFPIREFQLTQITIDHVQVGIEFLPSSQNSLEDLESMRKYIERETQSLVHIDIYQTSFSPGDKFQRYRTLV